MHRSSVTAGPFQASQGGFFYISFCDQLKSYWNPILSPVIILRRDGTWWSWFFSSPSLLRVEKYTSLDANIAWRNNFPKKYPLKGTFSRNTQWGLSMNGWTQCLYLWNLVCGRYLQHLWWSWCISFWAELLPFPSFKILFLEDCSNTTWCVSIQKAGHAALQLFTNNYLFIVCIFFLVFFCLFWWSVHHLQWDH